MNHVEFAKMHVCGNDFVVVDAVTTEFDLEIERVRAWGDRKKGIGFDQLLVIEPPTSPDDDFFMRIHNTDGGEAEQCGNGCAAVTAFVQAQGLSAQNKVVLGTLGGRVKCEIVAKSDVQLPTVKVQLTEPDLRPQSLPFVTDSTNCNQTMDLASSDHRTIEFTAVSVGNPHAVVFVDDVDDTAVADIGQAMQSHVRFPDSVNVEFVQSLNRTNARLRIYERGVGETLACGSGACAAMAAGLINGIFDKSVSLSSPGGESRVSWDGPGTRPELQALPQLAYKGRVKK